MIIKEKDVLKVIIPKKFSEKQIGEFMDKFWSEYSNLSSRDTIYFDFTQAEWVANQNLLLLSGLIKYLYNSNTRFQIIILPNDRSILNQRKVVVICELWYIWQLNKIFDKKIDDFKNYLIGFDIDILQVQCRIHNVNFEKYKNNLIYNLFDDDRYSVIPFVSLNYISNANYENMMEAQINPVYKLNNEIEKELEKCNCQHPFVSKTISAIITKELYDNFLDHFDNEKSFFKNSQDWAFMSISLKKGLNLKEIEYKLKKCETEKDIFEYLESKNIYYIDKLKVFLSKQNITFVSKKEKYISFIVEYIKQNISNFNFHTQEIEEAKSFFFDKQKIRYKNENLIHFSFIDFGAGIVETLGEQYKKEHSIPQGVDIQSEQNINNNVIKYAFKHNSSRNPIIDKYQNTINFIPRGLYDLLVIVKRYKGLLIVRSDYGKIIYNFSDTNDKENPISFDENKKEYFPGTYISIYIPALEVEEKFDKSVIRLEYEYSPKQNIPTKKRNVNMLSIVSEFHGTDTKSRYKQLIQNLSQKLKYDEESSYLTYLSFSGVADSNIIKKTIFYLVGSYELNEHNSIIIVYPPSKKIIDEINEEISTIDEDRIIQDFRINPIPVIYLDTNKREINLDWIGVSKEDKEKLNQLLLESHSLILNDLKDGYKAIGNTNRIDKYGNFSSKLPTEKELLTYYETTIIEDAIKECECIKRKKEYIYLCNGNYYQESFLQLTDILYSRKYENIVPPFLLHEIKVHIANHPKIFNIKDIDNEVTYIAITASSHKILNSLINKREIKEDNCIFLDSYFNFEKEIQNKIKSGSNYVLVSDAISTGNLAMRLRSVIKEYDKSQLIAVAVIADTLDTSFDKYDNFKSEFIDEKRFIYLYQHSITKYRREELSSDQKQKTVIRINPYTNIPIILSDENRDSILLSNEEFLKCIENDDIEIRFKLFNNLIHPYFFKTEEILKKENDKIMRGEYFQSIIHKIFSALKEKNGNESVDYIFYPKKSDIKHLKIKELLLEKLLLETGILGKEASNYFELERYNTDNGWKFPHAIEYCKEKITGKTVLILDDGSCSGDSMYQMANELSYYNPQKINVLSIIGRVENSKREFFTKIKSIEGTKKDVEINIYFGTHWHIPVFYQEINPYSDEIKWLDEIDKFSNVPEKIKMNAEKIKREIKPKSDKEIQQDEKIKREISEGKRKGLDYKFFPKNRNTEEIPKKEILTVRNEIGKVICHRFYKDSFEWFNEHLIEKTENCYQKMDERTKKHMEELLMCFLYEPYLYLDLIRTIPEIQSLTEKFVEDIIFEEKFRIVNLQYIWRKPDIMHLFFIAYQDYRLIEKLDLNRFKQLLKFADTKVNYVLCKLFYYYSSQNKEQYKEIFAKIKTEIIAAYLSSKNQQDIDKNVKLFDYFIDTLPSIGSFRETLKKIHEEYKRISDIEYHKENVNNKIESSLNCLNAIKRDEKNIAAHNILLKNLESVNSLVKDILSISFSQYKPYFSEHLSLFESSNINSLRKIQGRLAVILTTIFYTRSLQGYDIDKIYEDIKNLQDVFFDSDSIPYKIFHKISIENITEKISNYKDKINTVHKYNINNFSSSASVYFSDFIFEDIVLKNIFGNFEKYADRDEVITIDIRDKNENLIEIKINNKSNKQYANGGLIGTYLIQQLNKCPYNLFEYSNKEDKINVTFEQIITLKKI